MIMRVAWDVLSILPSPLYYTYARYVLYNLLYSTIHHVNMYKIISFCEILQCVLVLLALL